MAKYRIRVGDSGPYPFKVERKGFIFWHQVDMEKSLEAAEETLKRHHRRIQNAPIGTVLKVYDDSDAIVEKLKGNE